MKRQLRDAERFAGRLKRRAAHPRTGAKATVMRYVTQFPRYLKLLGGLLFDPRVSALDKVLVGAAIAYILNPFDFIPEVIPFFGQVDDVYLLGVAVQRLVAGAGRKVLMDHWTGSPRDLSAASLNAVVSAAAFFLPRGMGRRIRRVVEDAA